MYKVTYNGAARAIYDIKGCKKRDEINAKHKANGKGDKVNNKTVYMAGTVMDKVELPTGKAVLVDENLHPLMIEKLIEHVKNENSPFKLEQKKAS